MAIANKMNNTRTAPVGVLMVLMLASCGTEGSESSLESSVEVFSWWTSGSEAAALETVFAAYRRTFPQITVIPAVRAGA